MTLHCLTTRFPYLPMLLLALFALALQGCGDGVRILPPSDADPTGYYTNNGDLEVMRADNTAPRSSTVNDLQGMVTDGQLMMLSDTENLTYVGTFTVSGNDINGTVTVYEADVMTQQDVPLTGQITAGSTITGTLGGTGAANGTFTLNYAPLVDNGPVDMDTVTRRLSWEPVTGNPPAIPFLDMAAGARPAPAINMTSAGSGSEIFDNCGFTGRVDPITGTHLYRVSVTMVDCVDKAILATPVYTGLASVRSEVSSNDRLILVMTNGAYDFSGEYKECLIAGCL
ncbi:MAG: hypothetical protein L3K24_17245 [Gammaproteobacteria bacterium]|nr:hypothetical protein [Gammaproteobacteria bacterium]